MDEAFVKRGVIALTCQGGRAAVRAAEQRAAEIGVPQCIAVVDAGGQLLAFSRMDGARPASIEIAITKARSAALRFRATADEAGGDVQLQIRLAQAAKGDITGIGGGLPILFEGQTIGGIGVSSGTVAEDTEVASAGLAALSAS